MNTPTPDPSAPAEPALSRTTLLNLAIAALEKTAFVMAEPVEDDDASSGPPPAFATSIRFTGSVAGECVLTASEGFVRELAAGLLSTDPGEVDLDACGQDALNEFGNIIGGSIIRSLGADHHRIMLGLPAAADVAARPAPHRDAVCCTLDSCGERFSIHLTSAPQTAARAA
jgi:chemotaxis protein CheY-P-specific phosphatase CheC